MLPLRLLAVASLVLISSAALVPTLLPSWDPTPWPSPRLHLGVSLQGGTEVVLDVQLEVLVHEEVAQNAAYLESVAAEAGLGELTIQARGPRLEIVAGAPQAAVVELVDRLGSYTHVSSADHVHRFELSRWRRLELRDQAAARTLERFRARIEDACAEGSTAEAIGPGLVALRLPGHPHLEHRGCP